MRKTVIAAAAFALLLAALPAAALNTYLDGPNPAMWLSDPEGDDGDSGIEQGDTVEGATGSAKVNDAGALIKVKATGLEPGHTYTMWVVYFNDASLCVDGCNGADLVAAGGGALWGAGTLGSAQGTGTFVARLPDGAGADLVGTPPPPPFVFAAYEAGPNNEFHVVIRSHGPKIPGLVYEQLHTATGGCETFVGPAPEQIGDFPVPAAEGECGDIQLYVFK